MSSDLADLSRGSSPPPTVGARVGSFVVLLIILAFGLAFLFLMGREVYRITQAWRWPAIPCVIESSSIANQSNGYQLQVSYRYEFAGQTFLQLFPRAREARHDRADGHVGQVGDFFVTESFHFA